MIKMHSYTDHRVKDVLGMKAFFYHLDKHLEWHDYNVYYSDINCYLINRKPPKTIKNTVPARVRFCK